jgi:hypothetical protein
LADPFNMDGLTTCGSCSNEVTPDSDFCPHCGVLFEQAPDTMCEIHPDREADGVCIICEKVLCDECCIVKHSRRFCAEHADVEVEGDGAVLCRFSEPDKIAAVEGRLKEAGIEVYPVDQGTIFRQPYTILMVPIPEYLKARECVDELFEEPGPTLQDEKNIQDEKGTP